MKKFLFVLTFVIVYGCDSQQEDANHAHTMDMAIEGMMESDFNVSSPDMSEAGLCNELFCDQEGTCVEGAEEANCACPDGASGDRCELRAPRFVAFSGGGLHSHTALAGWFAGLLDATQSDLKTSLKHVQALSANSGGGWFMSMLAYSPTFLADLEQNRDNYTAQGYLGEITELLSNAITEAPCEGWSELLNSSAAGTIVGYICDIYPKYHGYFAAYKLNLDEAGQVHLNWHRFVQQLIYAPLQLSTELDGLTLSSPHLSWAREKSLLYAAALLSDEVMLAYDQDALNYWGLYASLTASDSVPPQRSVTPLILSSMGEGMQQAQAPLPAAPLSLTHTEVGLSPFMSTVEQLDIEEVSILDASTASSAALALGASYGMLDGLTPVDTGLMTASWFMSGFAPPADLVDGRLSFRTEGRIFSDEGEVGYQSLASVAERQTVRVADGGYVDNAAVTALVKHIQENGGSGFELVSLMNNTSPELPLGDFMIPQSSRDLFMSAADLPAPGLINLCASEDRCLQAPSNQVFTPESWSRTELLWRYEEAGITLSYYKTPVVTQRNDTYGIEEGLSGTLHLFVHSTSRTSALPAEQEQLDAYQDVYRVTREAIASHGGAVHLKRALGLD